MTLRPITLAILLLCGCASESSDDAPVLADANQSPDATTVVPAGCAGLLSSYDLSDATYAGYARRRDAGDETSPMVYGMTATLDEGPPADIFEIQLWSGFGVYKDTVAPGTVPISGDETSLFDCGLCALIFGDLASNGSTDTVLVAQSGTVEVEQINLEVGGSFQGSASLLRYVQVNSGGPIPGGCEVQVSNIQFDVTLAAP